MLPGRPDMTAVYSRGLSVNDQELWVLISRLDVQLEANRATFGKLAAALGPRSPRIQCRFRAENGIEARVEIFAGKLYLKDIRDSVQSSSLTDETIESIAKIAEMRFKQAERQAEGVSICR